MITDYHFGGFAKKTAERGRQVQGRDPNADLYQLLAYCIVLGLSRGHLVYAAGSGHPAVHTVRNSGVEIICEALDLGSAPVNLLAQVRDLAGRLATAAG